MQVPDSLFIHNEQTESHEKTFYYLVCVGILKLNSPMWGILRVYVALFEMLAIIYFEKQALNSFSFLPIQ